jgi:hypothetical protein
VGSDGKLWHTIRNAAGTGWQNFFGLVEGAVTGGPPSFKAVACAGTTAGLQVVGVGVDGKLWHTIRNANETWQGFFGLIEGAVTGGPPSFTDVSCGSPDGQSLQVVGVGSDGKLWHTIRNAAGTGWQNFFGLVEGAVAGGPPTFTAAGAAGAGETVTQANQQFTNWPQNIQFTAPLYYTPKTRAELANAILQAESAGHHVRAVGSRWSFSDAVCATDSSTVPATLIPSHPGAMIDITQLNASLQSVLRQILAPGVDATNLFHVEGGVTISELNSLLDHEPGRQALGCGGGRGQTLAGFISTSSHGGDSLVPPLADFICAIHLIGAGGIEHWIERDTGITSLAQVQVVYPGLSRENIHYNTDLFNAVLVSGGSMGIIYSVVLKTQPQFGLVQHQVVST